MRTLNRSQELLFPTESSPHLAKKDPDWKEWAYTDGSCQIHQGKRDGRRHIAPCYLYSQLVEANGMGITNTINRAELAAITAAVLHGHSRIATDSLSSLHQIRKHLLYPELHRHHIHGDILKILMQIIRNSPNPVHLFKVKSHAVIVDNECKDAVAKYQATQVDANLADTGMPCAGINGNPFYNITWHAYKRNIPSDSTSSRPSNLPTPKLPYFPNLPQSSLISQVMHALKTHMHSKHKLGHANPTTNYYSYNKGLLSLAHKSISNAFWIMFNLSFKISLLYRYPFQKHAVRFKTSTSLQCPNCYHLDLHTLSGCQHQIISNTITERHNIACGLFMKAVEAGSFGGMFCSNGYRQQRPLSLTKPTNSCSNYQQDHPRMALPLLFSY